jgi:hypothetical protein
MGVEYNQFTSVGNSPAVYTRVQPSTTAMQVVAENRNRKVVVIQNVGTVDVFIGGSGVTALTGQLLPAMYTNEDTSQKEISDLTDDVSSSAIYAITASGTADLRVKEVAEPTS